MCASHPPVLTLSRVSLLSVKYKRFHQKYIDKISQKKVWKNTFRLYVYKSEYGKIPDGLRDFQGVIQRLPMQIFDHNALQRASELYEAQANPQILQRQILNLRLLH